MSKDEPGCPQGTESAASSTVQAEAPRPLSGDEAPDQQFSDFASIRITLGGLDVSYSLAAPVWAGTLHPYHLGLGQGGSPRGLALCFSDLTCTHSG